MGPGDALHDSADSLVVGGVVVAVGLVDGGQGGFVQADGSYREAAFFGLVGEVGGDDLGRSRQVEVASAQGPGLEGPPGGGVHLSGVVGDAVVQGLADALDVGGRQVGAGRRWVSFGGVLGDWQEGVLHGSLIALRLFCRRIEL